MASIHERVGPRGTAYRVQYRDCFGHQYARTFSTPVAARGFQAAVNKALERKRTEVFKARAHYALDELLTQIEHARESWIARDFWLLKKRGA